MGVGGGTGVGGGSVPPMIREQETTAFVETEKKYVLAMLPNGTFEVIPFTQVFKHELFKYQTNAKQPLLPHILMIRVAAEPELKYESNWQQAFQDLINRLPEALKEQFIKESKLPFQKRDPSFVALSNVFVALAKTLLFLETVGQPIPPGSGKEELWKMNLTLPYIALKGALDQGKSTLGQLSTILKTLGQNFPEHDPITNILNQTNTAMEKLSSALGDWEKGGIPSEKRGELLELAFTFATLKNQSTLGILSSHLNGLEKVAIALSLGTISPAFALGLAMTSTPSFGPAYDTVQNGIVSGMLAMTSIGPKNDLAELNTIKEALLEQKANGATGFDDPELAKLLEKHGVVINQDLNAVLTNLDVAISIKMQEPLDLPQVGSEFVLGAMTRAVMDTISVFASTIAQQGIGYLPGSEKDQALAKIFTLELVLKTAYHSQAMDTVFKEIARASGADETNADHIAKILKLIAMLQALLAAVTGNTEQLKAILGSFKDEMKEGLDTVQNLTEGLEGEKADQANVFLEQAGIAINEENPEGFYTAYEGLLGLAGTTPEAMGQDFKTLSDFAKLASYVLTAGAEKETERITAVAHAV